MRTLDKMPPSWLLETACTMGFGQDGYTGFGASMSKTRTAMNQIAIYEKEPDRWNIDPEKVNNLLVKWGNKDLKLTGENYVIDAYTVVQFVDYGLDVLCMVIEKCFEMDKLNHLKKIK